MRAKTINFERNKNPKKALGMGIDLTKQFYDEVEEIISNYEKIVENLVGKTIEGDMWKSIDPISYNNPGGRSNYKFVVKEAKLYCRNVRDTERGDRLSIELHFRDSENNRYNDIRGEIFVSE